jgi:hypothetical protein
MVHLAAPTLASRCVFLLLLTGLTLSSKAASAQIAATARPGATPEWTKGITAISPESYYHAIECGKKGGADPACVFWDSGLCKNDDFALAFYTPYKFVAYDVWTAVRRKQAPPQPSYPEAQRTKVVISVSPVKGSKNVFTGLALKRDGKVVAARSRMADAGKGSYTYDYAPFAPTAELTIEMAGKAGTVSCTVPPDVLASFR